MGGAVLAPTWFLAIATLVLVGSRALFHFGAGLYPDEAYYWLWGQYPALSYFDHPPLNAWLQGLAAYAFGARIWSVRLTTVLASLVLAGVLLVWLRRIEGRIELRRAWALMLAVFASPVIFIKTSDAFNDHLLIAFLALATLPAGRLIESAEAGETPPAPAYYLTALWLGLAALSKYNAATFAIGLLALFALQPRLRSILWSRHFPAALALGLVCLAPVLIWNHGQDWRSFSFHLVDRSAARGFLSVESWARNVFEFALFSVLLLSPVLAWAFLRLAIVRRSEAMRAAPALWRIAAATFVASTASWCLLAGRMPVVFYWNIPAYVALLPLALLALESRMLFVAHVSFGSLAAMLFSWSYAVFPLPAHVGAVDENLALHYGWPEIADRARELAEREEADLLITTDYRTAAILAFHLGDPEVRVVSRRPSQFDLWTDWSDHAGQTALVLADEHWNLEDRHRAMFAQIAPLGELTAQARGTGIKTYRFYLGRELAPPAE